MKTIEQLEQEAKESFSKKQKEFPNVHSDEQWPYFYAGWLEMSYTILLKDYENLKKRIDNYEKIKN